MTEEEFLNKCIKIIKSSPSDDAKKEIAGMKHPLKNEKVGMERAEKVYYHYTTKYAVKYDIKKYCNNETEYINKIKKIG
jgi:hypothetical protein